MEDPVAENVTTTRSYSPTEQSADQKHPADPAVPVVHDATVVSPQEAAAGRSPVVGVRFNSPKPAVGELAEVLEPAASGAELHTPAYSEGEGIPACEAAYTVAESKQLNLPPEGSESLVCQLPEDGFEPHFLPLPEYDQVPTFDAVQAAEEPNGTSLEEIEVLASEASSLHVEHNAPMLLEGGEASVSKHTSPLEKGMEASSGLAQGGAEQIDEGCKEDKVDPDTTHTVGSDGIDEDDIEIDDGCKEGKVDPDFSGTVGSDGIVEDQIEVIRDLVEIAVDEFAQEIVESVEEDVEATCSGDVASENEFSAAVDMRRRGGRRRKRGRPSSKLQGAKFPSQKKDEEEVCFICFDGGDLVVCDRRGCPKVYHPSCVNRKEAYFQSKGQWSCGWHLCSKCQKSASYKCYTCTYSLCKLCINGEEFTCVRGNKGFCTACMTTILLMETNENANEKKDGVDFNDRSCWEYLFKDYWYELKAKLSMNLDELTKDRTASKVSDLGSGDNASSDDAQDASSDGSSACHDENFSSKKKLKLARNTACKILRKATQTDGMPLSDGNFSRNRRKSHYRNATTDNIRKVGKTEISAVHQENPLMIKVKKRTTTTVGEEGTVNDTESELFVHKKSSRKKSKRRSRHTIEENILLNADKEQTPVVEYTDWASKELLEFVSHVKNGDKSILSPYDVQELLLDYIKVNKLRDPRRKSQIICDSLLLTIFDKTHVGHFEMLKLLESHFFIKVSSSASDEKQGDDTDPIQMGDEVSNDLEGILVTDKRQITRKRGESKPQTNVYSYAAIDAHNISMMYLRRSLMEELIDDMNTFSEKVIGSFVRIRVTSSSQKQEVYRLVQVVGCGKAPEEYKTGKRTTDVMLEIINLDKKEVITVDIISNQDFTEEECKRLRQSIKFGFISRLTVGEVQVKAKVLQSVRIRDHLESEKLRLIHLRDRASEKGRKKEHRECVEKLHLLSSREEQMKRLNDVAQAHSDPKMDPCYESPEDDGDDDENKEGNPDRTIQSIFKERVPISPRKEGSCNVNGVSKSLNNAIASPQKIFEQSVNLETQKEEAKADALLGDKEPASASAFPSEPKLESPPAIVVSQVSASEGEKIWHYKDPSGKIQGPFSVVQLRKWSKHFPSNLAIWRKSERQEDSILLTDALAGNFQKDLPEWVPLNAAHLSSSSPSIISSNNIQENASALQSDKAAVGAACIDSITNLDNKHSTGSSDFYKVSRHEQVVAHVVNSESTQQASYQLIDVHNRPPVISSDLDPRKKFFEEPCGNGGNIQKHDFSCHLNSDICIHGIKGHADRVVEHSTSSTESNTVQEVSQFDHARTSFQKSGASDAKPVVESSALESSDTSGFSKLGPDTPQRSMPNHGLFANSANGQPTHIVPQPVSPCNWIQPTNTTIAEQLAPSLDSTTVLSGVSVGFSTSVNCQKMPPFPALQSNNSMSTVTHQPSNMSWVSGTAEANPAWQVQNQYQNPSSVPAMVGNNTNLGWGMIAQESMNTPWAVQPNVSVAWNQGLVLPPQGNTQLNFARPPPQGNIAPYPMWRAPVPMNSNQNPAWYAPIVANANQVAHPNNATNWDPLKDGLMSSNMQRERSSDRNFGSRDGGFRGAGPRHGYVRHCRNWMGSGNAERSSRPPSDPARICPYHKDGRCKRGASCNYIHSG